MQRCSNVHEVGTLQYDLAMQLFAACAFQTGQPTKLLAEALVSEVVTACAGLPLTLKVPAQKLPLPGLACASFQENLLRCHMRC